jgi:hypothetical protein
MESRLRLALDQCQIPVRPYTLASWREATEASLRGRTGLFTLTEDCFFDVEESRAPDSRLERWPICSTQADSSLLDVYGDVSNYLGSVTLGADREGESEASSIREFLMDTMVDSTIRRLPMAVLYGRLHRVLEQDTLPSCLALSVSTSAEIYGDIADGMVFWLGGENSSVLRLYTWLNHPTLKSVWSFPATMSKTLEYRVNLLFIAVCALSQCGRLRVPCSVSAVCALLCLLGGPCVCLLCVSAGCALLCLPGGPCACYCVRHAVCALCVLMCLLGVGCYVRSAVPCLCPVCAAVCALWAAVCPDVCALCAVKCGLCAIC